MSDLKGTLSRTGVAFVSVLVLAAAGVATVLDDAVGS